MILPVSPSGPAQGRAPELFWLAKRVLKSFVTEAVSPVETYAVSPEIPRSPGQTHRSRFAPSTRIVAPDPLTPLLSQLAATGGQAFPWSGSMVSICTV